MQSLRRTIRLGQTQPRAGNTCSNPSLIASSWRVTDVVRYAVAASSTNSSTFAAYSSDGDGNMRN
jgi:hypothetical protein